MLLNNSNILKLTSSTLNLVTNQCEQYFYYMAVCKYKTMNHLESLEYLKNEKLTKNYVSIN